jgi:tape measure domain-containing protein
MPSLSSNNDLEILIKSKSDGSGVRDAERDIQHLGSTAEGGGMSLGKLTKATFLGNIAAQAFSATIGALTSNASAAFGELINLQNTRQSFEVLTGSAANASKVMADLSKYAMNTPFEFNQIASATKTLLGFGSTVDTVGKQIRQIGDVAGATGGDINAIALVFGQIHAQGRMMTQDFYQLINQGVAVGDVLAKKLGVPTSELKKKLEEGAVTWDVFSAAMTEATSAGGRYYQGADKLSQTLSGRLSTLKDNFTALVGAVAGVDFSTGVIKAGGAFDVMSQSILTVNTFLSQHQQQISALASTMGGTFMTALFAIKDGFIALYNIGLQLAPSIMYLAMVVGRFLVDAFNLLKPSLDALWVAFTTNLLPALQNLWTALAPLLIPVLKTLAIVLGVAIVSALYLLINALTFSIKAWSMTYNVIAGFLNIVGEIAGGVGNAVSGAIRWFGKLYDSVASTLKVVRDLKDGIMTVSGAKDVGATLHSLHVPGFAGGVRNFGGGMAVVGENGPELVNLPKGADVYTNSDSKRMAGSTTINYMGDNHFHTAEATREFFDIQDRNGFLASKSLGVARA